MPSSWSLLLTSCSRLVILCTKDSCVLPYCSKIQSYVGRTVVFMQRPRRNIYLARWMLKVPGIGKFWNPSNHTTINEYDRTVIRYLIGKKERTPRQFLSTPSKYARNTNVASINDTEEGFSFSTYILYTLCNPCCWQAWIRFEDFPYPE